MPEGKKWNKLGVLVWLKDKLKPHIYMYIVIILREKNCVGYHSNIEFK